MRFSFVTAIVLCATHAAAAPEAIAVVSDDTAFRAALGDALAPAGMVLREANDEPPSISDITGASRAIADREHATSTVWLVSVDAGATLIAYDRGVDRVLVRPLPYPAPLTAPQAAEAARMTRTMLRALRVTPDIDQPPPRADAAPKLRADAAVAANTPPAVRVVAPAPPAQLALALDGGVSVNGPGTTATLAGALGAIWRPDRLGVVVTVRFAPAADVDALTGRIADGSLAACARLPVRVAPRIGLAATGGLALHRIALDGMLGTMPVDLVRYDPALRAGVSATYTVNPTIAVGLSVSVDSLLRRQSYEVGADAVVAVPVVQGSAGVVLVARIL